MANKKLASLLELKVSLNTDGNVVVDYTSPPDEIALEEAFDEWDEEYENTKKIVSLVKYLKNIVELQIKDISKILRH